MLFSLVEFLRVWRSLPVSNTLGRHNLSVDYLHDPNPTFESIVRVYSLNLIYFAIQTEQIFGSFCYDPYINLAVKFERFFELKLLVLTKFHFNSFHS